MKRAVFLILPLLGALGRSPAGAQSAKVYRVGILLAETLAVEQAGQNAFLGAMSGLGYQVGKNLEIVSREAAGDATRMPLLANELLGAKPDAIIADGGRSEIAALKRATTSVPIVMVGSPNPIGYGFVASLARPGGNVTGVSSMALELTGKRLQLLEELVPHLRRVAVIRNPAEPGNMAFWHIAQSTANNLGIEIVPVDVHSPAQIAGIAAVLGRQHADAVLVLNNPLFDRSVSQIVRAIGSLRLAAISQNGGFTTSGGLMYYGPSGTAMWSQAATYVARILKGANPADLPVQQPTIFDLVVNLKAAREIGITVPQSIQLQATQVIR